MKRVLPSYNKCARLVVCIHIQTHYVSQNSHINMIHYLHHVRPSPLKHTRDGELKFSRKQKSNTVIWFPQTFSYGCVPAAGTVWVSNILKVQEIVLVSICMRTLQGNSGESHKRLHLQLNWIPEHEMKNGFNFSNVFLVTFTDVVRIFFYHISRINCLHQKGWSMISWEAVEYLDGDYTRQIEWNNYIVIMNSPYFPFLFFPSITWRITSISITQGNSGLLLKVVTPENTENVT